MQKAIYAKYFREPGMHHIGLVSSYRTSQGLERADTNYVSLKGLQNYLIIKLSILLRRNIHWQMLLEPSASCSLFCLQDEQDALDGPLIFFKSEVPIFS